MPHWDWAWCAEIEKFPAAVLAARHPNSVNLGDVTANDFTQRAAAIARPDVIVGGPPCQAFSVAGLRQSLSDDRGNLSLQWVKIIHAIRPGWAITENVPGWLSTSDNAFGCFLAALVGADDPINPPFGERWPCAGMASGPWARAASADSRCSIFQRAATTPTCVRCRTFWRLGDPAAVLFEPESLCGHSPPRRQARKDVAPTIAARTKGGGELGTDFDCDGGLIAGSLGTRSASAPQRHGARS